MSALIHGHSRWKKVKNREKPPPPFINVDMQECCSQVLTGIFLFFLVTTLIKGIEVDILNLCHIMSTIVE